MRLGALETGRVGVELVIGNVGPIKAVELVGGKALDGGDGAGRGQHGDAILRHLFVQDVRQGNQRLVAR